MLKNVILGLVGAILLVAVAVGVVLTVSKGHGTKVDSTADTSLLTTTNSIETFCRPTTYQKTCQQTLQNAFNGTASARDVVDVSVQAINAEITKAFNLSDTVGKNAKDSMDQQAFDICKKLLEDARDELEAVLADVKDLQSILSKSDDIRTWLSAVISYQETCLDAIQNPELKEQMNFGLTNATELTSNTLAIIGQLSDLFKSVNGGNIKGDSRRHLMGQELPSWMSADDGRMLQAGGRLPKPNVVVAKDGSGNFNTISAAIKAMPKKYIGRYVIYVKAGVYSETVLIDKSKKNILMYGDGSGSTIVTGRKNFVDGVQTFATATFAVEADGFIAVDMAFANTAGAIKHQAVALRVKGDKSAFFKCRMDAFQDTLYAQAKRQFYRNCVISGTVDFIFGDSAMILQNCLILVRRPMAGQQCIVTASGRKDPHTVTGIVIHNCRIVPDTQLFPDRHRFRVYLGRPWKVYARTIVMESIIGDLIQPDGWMPWEGTLGLKTLYYAEYNNRGPGASTSGRVKWPGVHVINKATAEQFTVANFIQGGTWLNEAGIEYLPRLRF